MHDQAIKESLIPIRPGIPGVRPFWNVNARRFIYVPAFDFKAINGAKSYLFTATSRCFGISNPETPSHTEYKFEAPTPDALLTPIWKNLPIGTVELKCEALNDLGGKVIGLAGSRTFEKGAAFRGSYYQPELGYQESAELALKGTFKQSYIRCWLTTGKPDPKYNLYAYPSKIIGAVISGAAAYARLKPQPSDTKDVLEIGRKAANYLISYQQPKDTPLEGFTPTYQGKQWVQHANDNVLMMIYPAEAAEAYLDLYDVTKDKKYYDAAEHIADTYKRIQLLSGTWYVFVDFNTGKPVMQTLCNPTVVIQFLTRMNSQYGKKGYDDAVRKAAAYVMSDPMQTYNWHAQFEDGRADTPPYENMSRQEVCQFATYLFDNAKNNSDYVPLAEELLRFAEDQFVVWEVAPEHFVAKPVAKATDAKPEANKMKKDQSCWITPTVLEQYYYYVPVCRSMGMYLAVLQKAHQVTGKLIYLEKAKAIANALTKGQKAFMSQIDGQFPTLYSTKGTPAKWINNTVYPSKYLLAFHQYLADAVIPEPAPAPQEAASALNIKATIMANDDPNIPNVLIIGDSISIGYTAPVTQMLAGKANVQRAKGNCQFTRFSIEHIREWIGKGKLDVIHFNWGIWDMHQMKGRTRTSPEQYEKNLRELVGIMKATGAKLIWATTTPVGPVPEGAKNIPVNIEDVPVYNAIAAKVMKENDVAIDDLYSAVLPKVNELRNSDNRHYKPEGNEFLATHVVQSIQTALNAPAKVETK